MKWVHPFHLGVQGCGCIRAEDKDWFAHRFRQDDSVCCYAVCNKAARHPEPPAGRSGVSFDHPAGNGDTGRSSPVRMHKGVINAVSGNSITVDGMHLPCRAVFEIRTRAGGVVLPCFLTGRIVGSYAQVFGRVAYIRPAPQMYHPPVHGVPGQRTLQNLLRTALMPVGIALYVYGGGWNRQDTGSGNTAMHIGLPQSWIDFFDRQNACYAYRNDNNPAHSYYPTDGWNQYGYAGLDCSGYLGWTLYNTLHTESASVSDCDGYIAPAAEFAHTRPKSLGYPFPVRTAATACRSRPRSVPAISSAWTVMCGMHRSCRDGSIVIAHSTPSPSKTDCKGGGVQLSALNPASDADKNCQAYRLAERFMQRYSRMERKVSGAAAALFGLWEAVRESACRIVSV